jgi:hypothetical protein
MPIMNEHELARSHRGRAARQTRRYRGPGGRAGGVGKCVHAAAGGGRLSGKKTKHPGESPTNRREIMNRQSMLGLTAAGLIGLATSVSFGIANAQDTGKNVISTLNAPKPLGPYSQAIQVGKTVYLSGQIPTDP